MLYIGDVIAVLVILGLLISSMVFLYKEQKEISAFRKDQRRFYRVLADAVESMFSEDE